jgi:hypothetical protein
MATIPLQLASRRLDTGNVVQYPGGGDIGRAMQGAGDELQQVADRIRTKQEEMDRFKRVASEDAFNQTMENDAADLVRNWSAPDGAGIHDSIAGVVDQNGAAQTPGLFDTLAKQFREQVPESQRPYFDASLPAKRLEWSGRAAKAQYEREQTYASGEITKIINGIVTSILQMPNPLGDAASFDAFKAKGAEVIKASPLAPAAKQAALDAWDQAAPKALAQAITARDPGKLRAMLGMAPAEANGGNAVDVVTNKIIGVESGGNANAKNPNSSASGVGQFLDSTWVSMIRQHRPDIAAGKSAAQIIALKGDAALGREMTKAYTQDNAEFLTNRGLATTPGNLYLAHFLGPQGAVEVLKADRNAPIASVVGGDVVRANPFLSGKTVADTIAWSDKKMGGSSASVPADPRFASLSPDDRISLANADDVAFRQKESAFRAQANADYASYKDSVELNIVQGRVADERLISSDPVLKDGDKATLIRSFRSQNDTAIQTQTDLTALANGSFSVDPYASKDKTRVDNVYAEAMKHVPAEQQAAATSAIVQQTGTVPQPVINQMRAGLNSQDPAQVVAAAQTAQRISQFDPAALGRRDGGSEVQKAADDFSHMVNDLNLSPTDAAKRMIELNDPSKRQSRKALEPAAKEFIKSLADVDIASEFKTGFLGGTPSLGITPQQEFGIKADFNAIAEDMFYAKNGDAELAKNAALQQMKALYGVSDLAGNHILMKHPPERYWPKQSTENATTAFGLISIPGTGGSPWQYAISQLHNDIDEYSGRGAPGPITQFAGRLEAGNIDLANRPQVRNADGSISTVRSMSFEEDGKEVLVPTVSPDGRILSDQQAIDLYHQSGQFLGKFDTPEHADAYAQALHQAQEHYYRGDLAIDPSTVQLVSTPQTDADVKAGRMPGYAIMWKDANGNLQTIPGKLWRPDVSKMQAIEKANETQRQNEANTRARQNDQLYNMNILTGEPLPKAQATPAPKAEPGANIPADIPSPDQLQATPGNAM